MGLPLSFKKQVQAYRTRYNMVRVRYTRRLPLVFFFIKKNILFTFKIFKYFQNFLKKIGFTKKNKK